MQNIEWLEVWYKENCDGVWEHQYGVTIESLDNPGWSVRIDLHETKYAGMQMVMVQQDNGGHDWIMCSISKDIFCGCGDWLKLNAIIGIFREAATAYAS